MSDHKEMTFDEWKSRVNNFIEAFCGLSSDDLPDIDYRDMYDAGDTPKQAAMQAIRNAQEC